MKKVGGTGIFKIYQAQGCNENGTHYIFKRNKLLVSASSLNQAREFVRAYLAINRGS